MDAARKKVLDNPEQYKEHPEIMKYAGLGKQCVKCEHDAQMAAVPAGAATGNSPSKRAHGNAERISGRKRMRHLPAISLPERLVLNRLGFASIPRTPQKSIEEVAKKDEPSLPECYLAFLNAIDRVSSRSAIRRFDLPAFCRILTAGVRDECITAFVTKLAEDPLAYDKQDKTNALYIIVLAYIYCRKCGIDTRACRRRIDENAYLFKPLCIFSLKYQGDLFIDQFVVNMKQNTCDYNEAIFLNSIYMARNTSKTLSKAFHNRLIDSLERLADSHVFSFLKHVFTHSTVLFQCITEPQLYRLIVSFYANAEKSEALGDLLGVLARKVDDAEQNEALISQFQQLDLNALKYKKQAYWMEIMCFKTMSKYEEYFAKHRDSFNALIMGLREITKLYEHVRGQGREGEFLAVLIYLFNNMKQEFLVQVIKQYNSLMIDILGSIEVFDEEFLVFNREHWDTLANIVLVTQRIGADGQSDSKKKKCSGIRLSELSRQALALVEVIGGVEEGCRAAGLCGVVTLKSRGFKIG